MQTIRHKNAIQYIGNEKQISTFSIIMEYAAGGSLQSQIRNEGSLPMHLIKKYSKQIVEALSYLHSRGIAHRF